MDRLGTLIGGVMVGEVRAGPSVAANAGLCLWIAPEGAGLCLGLGKGCPDAALVSAALHWPLGQALLQGGAVALTLAPGDPRLGLAALLQAEVGAPRCGAQSLLAAYVEGLMVHVLRHAIESGQQTVGLLAGLAEPRLARALVAIHDAPAQGWSAQALAEEAGMSRSAFMGRFRDVVGQTPMAYLRGWRLMRAQGDLARGGRVAEVARRYGYRSADAFARAYQGHHGVVPSAARPQG
ncbi:AraC family transcriptional regulator [Pseudorhodobacter sp. E13]|uniref:helix-turn-helix transcriptional regulator n=1 Tax=Pseudorhodobacter sp. E13 TaxID=2487931 RepID=UPI000F8E9738|nr:helix-turn-helix transcriptional regulator [Pseudorhodobacter sp. E13]RUS60397.1 AraC family transcriptional regulator [Pseudorhodobacter sp. E13]